MNKFFYDKRIVFIYIITILVLLIGTTYALSSASSSLGLTTALIGIDGDAYGSPTFDSSNLDFKPILDTKVEESTDNVIKIDFSVGGAESNNNDNIIYDIALNGLDINCNLLSPYIKWKLLKEGTEVSSGSLDYKFDTIDEDGRLVLTTIQEDLPDYNENDKSTYDDYTFYMWFSDSCQSEDISTCKSAVDQSNLIGQNIEGKIEVELYTEGKKQLVRNPENVLSSSKCTGAYIATLNTNGGVLSSGVESSIKVISGSNWDPTSLPEPSRTDTVIFNTNGGSDITTVSNGINNFEIENTINTFSNIPKIKLMESSNNLIEISYDFVGWYLDKNLTIPVTSDVKVSNKNQKLYAKWIGDNTITLPSVTKEHYEFLGWFSDSSLKNKVGDAGDSYQVLKNTNLYAGWKQNYIQLTLNDNGGSGGMGTIYVLPGLGFYSDMELTNPITKVTVPTKTGHTFTGYTGLTDGLGNITASSSSISEGTTFTAGWSINSYNIKFIANQFNPVNNQTINGITMSYDYTTSYLTLNGTTSNAGITIMTTQMNFTQGEQFITTFDYISGSYTATSWGCVATEIGINTTGLSDRNWSDIGFPTSGSNSVNFIVNESAATEGTNLYNWMYLDGDWTFTNYKIKVTVTKNDEKQLQHNSSIGNLPTPTKTGYTFNGWYTGENGTGTKVTSETLVPANNVTYYAKWTVNSYTVTYNSGNLFYNIEQTSTTTGTRARYSVDANGVVTMTASVDDGYEFTPGRVYLTAGTTYTFNCTTNGTWGGGGDTVEGYLMLDGQYNTYYWLSNGGTIQPTVSGEYWLRLDVNTNGKTYTFSNLNISYTVQTKTYNYGSTYGTLPSLSMTNNNFNGWYTAVSGGTKISSITSLTIAENHTLYGQWTAKNYSIGSTYYATLADAISGASAGSEIKVLRNYDDGTTATVNKNLTINTNGFTLTRSSAITINSGVTCTISGSGTLQSAGQLITNAGILNITHTGTIKTTTDTVDTFISNSGTVNKTGSGTIQSSGKTIIGGTVNISAGTVKSVASSNNGAEERAIDASSVTVSGGTVDGATYGIVGSATVTGGTVTGQYGICPMNGTATVTGGTVTGTGYGIVVWGGQTGVITVGSSSATLSTTTPVVSGGSHGVVSQTTFYFYNGVIKGTNATPYSGTYSGRKGYSIRTTSASGVYSSVLGNTYAVSFDKQGGTGGSNSATATYGSAMPAITAPSRSYTVTYDANGGSVSTTSKTVNSIFDGYYTLTGGGGTQYYNSTPASVRNWDLVSASATTLYAKWTNGTTTLPTPTLSGYTFNGWYTSKSGGTKVGGAGASYTVSSTHTIYAQWKANTYTVTYDANGGTGAPGAQNFVFNSGATISTTKPTRSGYIFSHWEYSGNTFAPGAAIPTGWGSFTLTAQWTLAAYKVSNASVGYNTLKEAVAAAESFTTITLQKNVTDNSSVTIDYGSLTLNLGNYTLTRNATIKIETDCNDVVIQGTSGGTGKITTSGGQCITNYGGLTVKNLTLVSTTNASIQNFGEIVLNTVTIPGSGGYGFVNGGSENQVGVAWITNSVISGSSNHTIRNYSKEKWPSSSSAQGNKMHYCTQSCSIHITGTTKVSQTAADTYYAVMNSNGKVHSPKKDNGFTGYYYSKNTYVLRNNENGTITINGGTLYAKNSSYYTNNTGTAINIGSGVSKKTGSP